MRKSKLLYNGTDWTIDKILDSWKVVDDIAKNKLGLDYYEPQFEIVSFDHMLDACSSHGLPNMYPHWSYGKEYIQSYSEYLKSGHMANEIIINTDPAIAYMVENNTMTQMLTVMCHASVGHSNFFKNNYCFKKWTNSKFIIEYLEFARDYIQDCEDRYGPAVVEATLDAAHSLSYNSVDKYPRARSTLQKEDIKNRTDEWLKYGTRRYNDIYSTVPKNTSDNEIENIHKIIDNLDQNRRVLPEENLLYYLEKHGDLEDWQREVCRIVRKIAQYFYPQMQTKMMNEGWASFIHYEMMNILHSEGRIDDGSFMEFLEFHSAVISSHIGDNYKIHQHLNPYAVGLSIFQDLKRVCLEPTKEDEKWFPEICNTDPWKSLPNIMSSFRDESFITQYLSKTVAQDFKIIVTTPMEELQDNVIYQDEIPYWATHRMWVLDVADDEGFIKIREEVSKQFDLSYRIPQITIVSEEDDRYLTLEFKVIDGLKMYYKDAYKTMDRFRYLWGSHAGINYVDLDGKQVDIL